MGPRVVRAEGPAIRMTVGDNGVVVTFACRSYIPDMSMIVLTLAQHTGDAGSLPVRGAVSLVLFLAGIVMVGIAVYLLYKYDSEGLPR